MSWLERIGWIFVAAVFATVVYGLLLTFATPQRDCRPAVVLMQDGEWT